MNKDAFLKKVASLTGSNNFLVLKDGINTIRFVGKPGEEQVYRECYRHFLRDAAIENFTKAPVCSGDDSCPACKYVDQLRKGGEDKRADLMKAQHRYLWPVFSRDIPFNDAGELCIKIYEFPVSVLRGLGDILKNWEDDFTDPVKGYDIEVVRITQAQTKYEVRPRTTKQGSSRTLYITQLTEEELGLIETAYPDLDAEITPPDSGELAAALGMEPAIKRTFDLGVKKPVPFYDSKEVAPKEEDEESDVSDCPKYGTGFDTEDEACRVCESANDCKTETDTYTKEREVVRKPRKG